MSDTTPEPTEKQQAVLEWIKSNQKDEPDKHDIADAFGVEPDTAKYYVEQLRECGFDIPYVPTGPKSGFYAYEGEDDIPKGLITALEEGGLTYEQLQDEYDLSKAQAKSLLDDLREEGRPIEFEEIDGQGTRLWYLADERDKKYAAGNGDGVYRFALISDTHLGSKAEHLDELHDFYDRVVAKGIDTVYHAGDISDGYRVYRHHVNELKPDAIGWQRLRQYVQTHYPQRDGVTTHFITGNHDYKFYKQNGLHFGKLLDEDRPDLNWLGEMQATIVFDAENGIDLELIHPSGGTPYTLGYRAQTLYRERPPESRPTNAGIGHLHDKMHANAEGVEAFYTGCWQGPTPYIIRKGLPTKIGGWIVELEIENGHQRRLSPDWIDYKVRGNENSYAADELAQL